jgi:large subunit ribosomal protein L10
MNREKQIPEKKIQLVEDLSKLLKNKKTVLLASIKNIPASQFQNISKSFRGKAIIKVPKKNLIFKALDSAGDEEIKKLKEEIKDNTAIIFSDLDCFELALELIEKKTPAKAKAGQEAPEDIEVPAGPTELLPGPAISELGAVGLQVQIDKGKITIKQPKVIVKEGEAISREAADVMNKLDIKPFNVGFLPLSAFDTESKKLYLDIEIDREEALENLKQRFGKALAFAVEIGYINEDTVKFLLGKAVAQANKINRIMTGEPEPAPLEEVPQAEEVKEEKKEEPQVDAAAGLGALFG